MDDCRNIYSKLTESFMLDALKDEVPVNDRQFGGVKGIGTDHMIIELVNDVMECLEDQQSAVSLISVDLSKAFNCICPTVCVNSLAKYGAFTDTIRIVANFLHHRSMRIKIRSGAYSSSSTMPGGAPQGTKSGNFLFCMATLDIDHIGEQVQAADASPQTSTPVTPTSGTILTVSSLYGLSDISSRLSSTCSSPIGGWTDTRRKGKSVCVK